jgi:hypothetical protein
MVGVWVIVGVNVSVDVLVGPGVLVDVFVGVFVDVCVIVGVSVGPGVDVSVSVGVRVLVDVDVLVGVLVIVGVRVLVGVLVIVGVRVLVDVDVLVGVLVGVSVIVGVFVTVLVGVGVHSQDVKLYEQPAPLLYKLFISSAVNTLFQMATSSILPRNAALLFPIYRVLLLSYAYTLAVAVESTVPALTDILRTALLASYWQTTKYQVDSAGVPNVDAVAVFAVVPSVTLQTNLSVVPALRFN